MNRAIALLLITCGLLFGCDEDDAGDDAADSAEDSSSSDAGESGSDDSTGELEPWDLEVQRCGEIVDCFAADCDAEQKAYVACREENPGDFQACTFKLGDFEACSMGCAKPVDSECPYEGQDCKGPYEAGWFAASRCILEEVAGCELDGPALCSEYYGV